MRVIAHISDLHFGRHDPKKVEGLLESLRQVGPDLIAVSGDLTQRARRREFAQARNFLERIGPPIIVVPGNHDVPLYDVYERLFKPFANFDHFIAPVGDADCLVADDEFAVLGLNTARRLTWKNGRVSLYQMSEIQRVFSNLPTHVWKILVTHHPVASIEGKPQVELAGRSTSALRAVASAGVHLLLSGHHHQSASGGASVELLEQGSVLVVHAGTAVSTRTRGAEGTSYNVIQLENRVVTISVMEWSGSAFKPTSTTPYVFG